MGVAYKKTAAYKEFQAAKKAKKFAKKPKDKNAPKRPSSAFFCFSSDVREDVKAELGEDATIGNVGKELGKLWGMMSEEDKSTYFAKSEKLKARYQVALEKYQSSKNFAAYQEELAVWKQVKKDAKKAEGKA